MKVSDTLFKKRYLFENKYQQTLSSDKIIKNRLKPIKPKGKNEK